MPERSHIALSFLPTPDSAPVEWRIEPGLTQYEDALAFMEARADAIRHAGAPEMVWLVEHPPLYTAGTSAQAAKTSSSPTAFRSSRPGAAANTPITGPASGWPM